MKKSASKKEKKAKKKRGALRLFRWGSLLPIALLLGLGIALFAVPQEKLHALSIATGVILSFVALLLIAGSFLGSASVLRIVCGVGLVALAVWLFVQPGEGQSTLYYVLSGIVLLRALVGLFYALFAKRKESRLWQISLWGSVFLLVAAVVYFFLPMLRLSGQHLLLGALCCLDALFETAALLHRLMNAMKKEETQKPEPTDKKGTAKKGKKRGEAAEVSAEVPAEVSAEVAVAADKRRKKRAAKEPPEEQAEIPQEVSSAEQAEPPQETEGKKPSFFARFRKKKE